MKYRFLASLPDAGVIGLDRVKSQILLLSRFGDISDMNGL